MKAEQILDAIYRREDRAYANGYRDGVADMKAKLNEIKAKFKKAGKL